MGSSPEKELKESMIRLLQSGEYSDMAIICGDEIYKVHKAIESQTCQINLSDYNPHAVKLVIDFFYLLDYTPLHSASTETGEREKNLGSAARTIESAPEYADEELARSNKKGKKKKDKSAAGYKNSDVESSDLAQPLRNETYLLDHCHVYALADYLQVSELKGLAASKFRTEVEKQWYHPDFFEAIQAIYGTSTRNDRLLRDIVVEILRKKKDLLDRFEYQNLISELDLAFELLMSVHKAGGWG
ncbi:hypothetical protein ACKVWM_011610 [Pyricularia oryzae]